jgi:hypothetical protein
MSTFRPGNRYRFSLAVTSSGAAEDPASLVLTIRTPAGVSTDYAWPSPAEVTRASLGNFYYDYEFAVNAAAGDWNVRWRTIDGTPDVTGLVEYTITVLPLNY